MSVLRNFRRKSAGLKNTMLYFFSVVALKYASKKQYFLDEKKFTKMQKKYSYMHGKSHCSYSEEEETIQANSRFDELMRITGDVIPKRVCEIGPGSGLILKRFANEGCGEVFGVDIQEPTFKDDRVSYALDGVHGMNEIEDNSVDLLFSYDAFEHIPDPIAGMNNCLKKLKPGGVCYFQIGPSYYSPWGFHYYHILNIPYIHVLFPESILNKFAREKGHVYPWTNRVPASHYIRFFQNLPTEFNLQDFRYDYSWYYCGFIAKNASLFKSKIDLELDDFLIGAMFGKITKAESESYLR